MPELAVELRAQTIGESGPASPRYQAQAGPQRDGMRNDK